MLAVPGDGVAVKEKRIVRGTHRWVVGELVGIGINEKLAGQGRAVGAGPQRYSRGQVPAGAVATDREAGRVCVFCPEKPTFSLSEIDQGKLICVKIPQKYQVEKK